MKKIFFMPLVAFLLISGCGISSSQETNYFFGSGDLHNSPATSTRSISLYDNDNIYFHYGLNPYMKLTANGTLTVNCDNAVCTHTTPDCKAYGENIEYFIFNSHLYQVSSFAKSEDGSYVYQGIITDCDSGKTVFTNSLPPDMDESLKLYATTKIQFVNILSDDILLVSSNAHAYILDADFNVLYHYYDTGKLPGGFILDNKYYYVNDLFKLVSVDMDTFQVSEVELTDKIISISFSDTAFYYIDQYSDLKKYSTTDHTTHKLMSNISNVYFYNNYLYCSSTEGNLILDINGKQIGTFSDHISDPSLFVAVHDKLYYVFETGISVMDENGNNYNEFFLSNTTTQN